MDSIPHSKMTKSQAGRLGGLTTLARHGKTHFKNIGRLGGLATRRKYCLLPVGVSGWSLVDRRSGIIKAVWGVRNG